MKRLSAEEIYEKKKKEVAQKHGWDNLVIGHKPICFQEAAILAMKDYAEQEKKYLENKIETHIMEAENKGKEFLNVNYIIDTINTIGYYPEQIRIMIRDLVEQERETAFDAGCNAMRYAYTGNHPKNGADYIKRTPIK